MIKNFSQYLVEESKEVVFTFGRMNPPTIGHGKVIDTIVSKSRGADYKIFVSQTQGPKDPLSYSDKVKHMRKMFPKHGGNIIVDKSVKNVFNVAVKLYDMGYKKITMVVGSDRVSEFSGMLDTYNGKKARHGFYNFESINVVSAGQRDPDAEGVAGMSASKQRANAKDNNYQAFTQGVPKSMSDRDTRKLFNDVRKGLGLKEERTFKRHIDLGKKDDTREAYVEGKLYEIGDTVVVKESDEVGVVSVLGANYVIVECGEKRLRKWLDAVELVEKTKTAQDPDVDEKPGTQPKNYYKGVKKKTKAARAAHFRKNAQKDDDDKSAYKPAPGDAKAKTKPSTYTKQFKQMYGESGAGEEGTDKLVKKYKKDTPGQNESVDEKFFGKTGAFGDKSIGGTLMPAFDRWMDKKVYNKKKYEKVLRSYLNWRRKNPKAGSGGAFDHLRGLGVERPSVVIDFMQDLIKKGKLPKHLSFDKNRKPTKTIFPKQDFRGVRAQTEEVDESLWANIHKKRKEGRPMRKPGEKGAPKASDFVRARGETKEDAVKTAKDAINREKETDKKKHDRMLDRARLARAKAKNRETK